MWITKKGNALICNNNSHISSRDLRKVMVFIEANSNEIMQKWYEYFGEDIILKQNRMITRMTYETVTPESFL